MLLIHKHGLDNGDYIFISVTYYSQIRHFGYYGWRYVSTLFDMGNYCSEIIMKVLINRMLSLQRRPLNVINPSI